MSKLSTNRRDDLPGSAFALPEQRAYPLTDVEHGRKALQLEHNASPSDQSRIEAAVHRKFPSIGRYKSADQK